jgi:hypothetical protein
VTPVYGFLWLFFVSMGLLVVAVALLLINDLLEDTMFDPRTWRRK